MQHPDPCGWQVEQIEQATYLYDLAYVGEVWLFYDYSSLFQYMRQGESQELSFKRAMSNMHVLYSHECSFTFRIQHLTPEAIWREKMDDETQQISVFFKENEKDPGSFRDVRLNQLKENRTPYLERGWCQAEVEWSSARSETKKHQRVDAIDDDEELEYIKCRVSDGSQYFQLKGRVPMHPEKFREQIEKAKFTHRVDMDPVIKLQSKIFHEKVQDCREANFEYLPAAQIEALGHALPHYQKLRALTLYMFKCGKKEADVFAEAGALMFWAGLAKTGCWLWLRLRIDPWFAPKIQRTGFDLSSAFEGSGVWFGILLLGFLGNAFSNSFQWWVRVTHSFFPWWDSLGCRC